MSGTLHSWSAHLSRRLALAVLAVAVVALLAPAAAAQPLTFTHLAGSIGGPGSDDGAGSAARFEFPLGVAVDASGNAYVADGANETIRKVSPSGDVTTLAGLAGTFGDTDGTGSAALFWRPSGVALDASGNLYVADRLNHTIRKVTPTGAVTTVAGLAGVWGSADGTGSAARFHQPTDVAVDASGDVYVSDSMNHTIRKVTPAGEVTTVAGLAGISGSADGTGSAARFFGPSGVGVAGSGDVYVAEGGSDTIRKITPAGMVTTLAGLAGTSGSADGAGSAARFYDPSHVTVDASGVLYVTDTSNHTVRRVTAGGVVTTVAGLAGSSGSADGTGSVARFREPTGIAMDGSGDFFVADGSNHTMRRMTAAGQVTTLTGLAGASGSADGTGTAARFDYPTGVAADASGNSYVADMYNHTVRKVTAAGEVTTLAGLAGSPGIENGTGSVARFYRPAGVAVDESGTIYVADQGSNTIRKVSSAGVVTTLAGLALSPGSADGTGSGARFSQPTGVSVDASGNVYVADTHNVAIRKVTAAGVVTTLAGRPGYVGSSDGTGSWARFGFPTSVAVDASGNVYVADKSSHTIRKVTASGVVTTLAGLAGSFGTTDGTGSLARFDQPSGVAVDSSGTVYVAEYRSHTVRKVSAAGEVTTLGGLAGWPGNSDGAGTAARFYLPEAVAVGTAGDVHVADSGNGAIRKGTPTLADSAVIDQPVGVAGEARQLGASAQTATSWSWTQTRIPAGSAAMLTSTSIRNPSFTPDVAGFYVFRLTASDGTAASITQVSLDVGILPAAAVSGGGTICAGGAATIQAALAGTPPWSLTWSDGVTQSGVTASPAMRNVSPVSTTTYTLISISNPYAAGAPTGMAVVTVQPLPSATISAQGAVALGQAGNVASVPDAGAGATYAWDVTNGTIDGGDGTPQVAWTAGAAGWAVLRATVMVNGCAASGVRPVSVGAGNPVPPLTFTHLAGSTGGASSLDGPASSARFALPAGVAVDALGNTYVADSSNHTIRKVTPAGGVTTLAGLPGTTGTADGRGGAARFNTPTGVAVDSFGDVYVADGLNHTVRKVTPTGEVTTLAGLAGVPGIADGTGTAAGFNGPTAVAVDASGSLYVAEGGNRIRKVTPAGEVTTLAGLADTPGSADGTGSAARFAGPAGVAVDGSGTVYVADFWNNTVRMVTPTGEVTTIAGLAGERGYVDGIGSTARFNYPNGIAVDASGNLYLSDEAADTIRKVTPEGEVTTLAGLGGYSGSTDGTGSAARFDSPEGVAVDGSGTVYVADRWNSSIRKVTATGEVSTLAGSAGTSGDTDGTGSSARFSNPGGVAVDASGTAHVADYENHTIRKVTAAGVVSTLAGLAGSSGSADGMGSAARFYYPTGVAVDPFGNVFVADRNNRTIRKVTAAGEVTTMAGLAGSGGLADGTGSAARFDRPASVTVDTAGNAYVADQANTIRKVSAAGLVTTLAGDASASGSLDGTGSAARFWYPSGVAVDLAGNVYVADSNNHTIRKVTAAGEVTTMAGLAGDLGSADGMGSSARFDHPTGLATDGSGNVYVADSNNHTVRRVTPAGVVTTLGGLAEGYRKFPGTTDGTGSAAQFYGPNGIAVGFGGEITVGDSGNNAIRKGTATLADQAVVDEVMGLVGDARVLGTSPQTATTWLWEESRIPAGSTATLSSTTVRNPTFTPDVADTYVFRLTASDGTKTSVTSVSLVAALAGGATATVSGGGTICGSGDVWIQAALAGTPPWSLTWSDGVTQDGITSTPLARSVTPAVTSVYTVTSVSDPGGAGTPSGSATVTVLPVPATPVITAPDVVTSGATGLAASVAPHVGSTYTWSITNGTITDGQGMASVTFTAGAEGLLVLAVTETSGGCASAEATKGVTVVASLAPRLHTLTPCRLLDTRTGAGVAGGGALAPLEERSFPIAAGSCGVPSTANALAVNVTVVAPEAVGYLTLWPSDATKPLASTINFTPGVVRANNAIVKVAGDGQASVSVFNGSTGTTDVLLDVNGYFE